MVWHIALPTQQSGNLDDAYDPARLPLIHSYEILDTPELSIEEKIIQQLVDYAEQEGFEEQLVIGEVVRHPYPHGQGE